MSNPRLIFIAAVSAALVFSCSSTDIPDLPPPQSEISSSSVDSSSSVGESNSSSSVGISSSFDVSSSSVGESNSSSSVGISSSFDVSSSSIGGGQNQSSSSIAITGFYGDDIFIDPRDGKEYKYKIRTGKVWMDENLNYSRDNTIGYCYGIDIYGENSHRDSLTCGNGYGRTYDWTTAIDGVPPQGLCPPGWHIPSITEWDGLYGITRIYAGNYNLNTAWPPLGWKVRSEQAFYWTSSGYKYFVYVDSGSYFATNPWSIDDDASIVDMFSVRCIADDPQSCNGNDYSIATHFCYAGEAYIRCDNGSTYDAVKYFCFGKTLYNKCGGQAYTPGEQECIGNSVFSKCGTTLYNPETHYCSGTTIIPK